MVDEQKTVFLHMFETSFEETEKCLRFVTLERVIFAQKQSSKCTNKKISFLLKFLPQIFVLLLLILQETMSTVTATSISVAKRLEEAGIIFRNILTIFV